MNEMIDRRKWTQKSFKYPSETEVYYANKPFVIEWHWSKEIVHHEKTRVVYIVLKNKKLCWISGVELNENYIPKVETLIFPKGIMLEQCDDPTLDRLIKEAKENECED